MLKNKRWLERERDPNALSWVLFAVVIIIVITSLLLGLFAHHHLSLIIGLQQRSLIK